MRKEVFILIGVILLLPVVYGGGGNGIVGENCRYDADCGPCLYCATGSGGDVCRPMHGMLDSGGGCAGLKNIHNYNFAVCDQGSCTECDQDGNGARNSLKDACKTQVLLKQVHCTEGDTSQLLLDCDDSDYYVHYCRGLGDPNAKTCTNSITGFADPNIPKHCCDSADNDCDTNYNDKARDDSQATGADCLDNDAKRGGECSSYCACLDKNRRAYYVTEQAECKDVGDYADDNSHATCESQFGEQPKWNTDACSAEECTFIDPADGASKKVNVGETCYKQQTCKNKRYCKGDSEEFVCEKVAGSEPQCQSQGKKTNIPVEACVDINPCYTAECDDSTYTCLNAEWFCSNPLDGSGIKCDYNRPAKEALKAIDPTKCKDADTGKCSKCDNQGNEIPAPEQDTNIASAGSQDCANSVDTQKSCGNTESWTGPISTREYTKKEYYGICSQTAVGQCIADDSQKQITSSCNPGTCGASCDPNSVITSQITSCGLGKNADTCTYKKQGAGSICSDNCVCEVQRKTKPYKCDPTTAKAGVQYVCDIYKGWVENGRFCDVSCATDQCTNDASCSALGQDAYCDTSSCTCIVPPSKDPPPPQNVVIPPPPQIDQNTPTCTEALGNREGGCAPSKNYCYQGGDTMIAGKCPNAVEVCCLCPPGTEWNGVFCAEDKNLCDVDWPKYEDDIPQDYIRQGFDSYTCSKPLKDEPNCILNNNKQCCCPSQNIAPKYGFTFYERQNIQVV